MFSRQTCIETTFGFNPKDFFLQNDDDPDVQAELERRIKNAEKRESNRNDPDKEKRSADTEGKGEKWKDLHMSIAASRPSLSFLFFRVVACAIFTNAGKQIRYKCKWYSFHDFTISMFAI